MREDESPDTQEPLAGCYEKMGYKLSQNRAGQITMSLSVQNQTSPASVLTKMSWSIVSCLSQALALLQDVSVYLAAAKAPTQGIWPLQTYKSSSIQTPF